MSESRAESTAHNARTIPPRSTLSPRPLGRLELPEEPLTDFHKFSRDHLWKLRTAIFMLFTTESGGQ